MSLSFSFFKHHQPQNHNINSQQRQRTHQITKSDHLAKIKPQNPPKSYHTRQNQTPKSATLAKSPLSRPMKSTQIHIHRTTIATLAETQLKSIHNKDPQTHQITKSNQLVKIKPQNPPKLNYTTAHTCRTTEP